MIYGGGRLLIDLFKQIQFSLVIRGFLKYLSINNTAANE